MEKSKWITCACGAEFEFTAGEQAFYQERELIAPKRCPACRAEKRKKYDTKTS